MESWLVLHEKALDLGIKMVTAFLALVGGFWGLYQYFQATRLRATETLLKVEEEFRVVLPVYAQLEDANTYQQQIKPVLQAEADRRLNDDSLKKLMALDRALRFLYFCSVLNESLRADRALGVNGGALQRAYYHYIALLLPDKCPEELLQYTHREYPRLTKWVQEHASELRRIRLEAV
ncbi:MAG TPA: hypothetical protein VGJ78_04105 [Vicinamibacterales bacterium]|jgi:hypothetical protein